MSGIHDLLGVNNPLLGPINSLPFKLLGLDDLASSAISPESIDSLIKQFTKSGMTGQQIEQNAWTAQREDTQYQRGVEDMKAAGLNPALMYQSSAQPAPSSAAAAQSGSALSLSDMLELMALPVKMKAMNAEIDRTEAQAENIEADTANKGVEYSEILNRAVNIAQSTERMQFDLQFLRDTRSLDIRAKELANNLSQAEFDKIYQWIDESIEHVHLMSEEAKSEESKRLALAADCILKYAQANEIAQLIEFKKLVMSSQASLNDASAQLALTHNAWQSGLIDRNVLDALASTYFSDADSAEARAEVNQLTAALKSPSYNWQGITDSGFCRAVFSAMSMIGDMMPFTASTKIQ